ncbi:hypothetical protein P280DRAFT_471597 [Massarina eburnea CBS 473.64]|uniref:18S rRNA factor 2 n=1 Tax=Massarina eburnea CBS 473.64 TaxID=1395130 RepID=A0A6A6RSA1_9PLEO|nr:hypothetical protein P280DRAFT_471597 [Massarina eburnea CBS 473.64]
MATRKRNEYLDADESDDDEQNYESEDEGRAQMLRSKRQKVDHTSDLEDGDDAPSDEDNGRDAEDLEQDDDDVGDESNDAELKRLEKLRSTLPTEVRIISDFPLPRPSASDLKKDKSGVVYLSRVPPFMKPAVLRTLLVPYGPVGRIFLTPESATQRQQRLKSGGTRRKLFLDGWVEFLHKKDAKFVADNLNAQTMGGKKRSRWHDEVWNVKYLSGVKWAYLVDEIQNQNAERADRLRKEIAKDKVENQRFLDNLEKGKMIQGMQAKRKENGKETSRDVVEKEEVKPKKRDRRSKFEQHEMRSKFDKKGERGEQADKVLSSIF